MKKNFCVQKKLLVPIAVYFLFLSQVSFITKEQRSIEVPTPTKDFRFLRTYSCIYELYTQDQWEKNPGRSFDNNGVHLTNGKYHPVNACHYALYCYDDYKATGTERFRKAFLAQVSYLRDSTKYDEYDGIKVGYPYLIQFHDLKPPWYSALAQSEAISVLVRYYAMTNDKTILPLIVKLRNFMVAPMADGRGTMNMTPEGNIWFEEYPNSPQEKQVLNGFFLGLVALYDYINLFPDDKESKDYYERAIKSAKESIKFYDTGSWLKYNRGDQRLVANGYIKWQILEMKLVYATTNDEFFKNLYMLWSSYAYDKPYETPGCKKTNYNFSIPLKSNNKGELLPTSGPIPVQMNKEVVSVTSNCGLEMKELSKIYDANIPSHTTLIKFDSIKNHVPELVFNLRNNLLVNSAKITLVSNDSIAPNNIELYYLKDSTTNKWVKITPNEFYADKSSLLILFNEMQLRSLKVKIIKMKSKQYVRINDITLLTPPAIYVPDFYHYITQVYQSSNSEPVLEFNTKEIDDILVFYKSANSSEILIKELWTQNKIFKTKKHVFKADTSKYFQFLIIAKPNSATSNISNIVFKSK
jgi:D-glucuronyl C5-epimerase C-terminus